MAVMTGCVSAQALWGFLGWKAVEVWCHSCCCWPSNYL